ncbi:MAG TPA: ATP-binding cassette domain-containing protein [Bacillota bacterium]|nr:ATP-binding cassette domain-containing protein [Bacillota bacterium]
MRAVSLHIKSGEIHGIVGASGAGKTTLLRMMNFLEQPDKGEVVVSGAMLNELSPRELRQLRQSIGMIFQDHNLLGNKTVFENVVSPLKIARINKREHEKRVIESLQFVGLAEHRDKYPSQLSGGQKQRVAIARAIVNHPKVLLCDEPTSSLDPNTTAEVLELLKRINETFHVTIVFVSHEMDVIKSICERVTVVEDGEVYDDFGIEPVGVHQSNRSAAYFVEQLKSGGGDHSS